MFLQDLPLTFLFMMHYAPNWMCSYSTGQSLLEKLRGTIAAEQRGNDEPPRDSEKSAGKNPDKQSPR